VEEDRGRQRHQGQQGPEEADWQGDQDPIASKNPEFSLLKQSDIDVSRLLLNVIGTTEDIRVEDSIIAGEVVRSMRATSEISITIHDADRAILKSGRLQNDDGNLTAVDVLVDGMWWRTADLDKQGDELVFTLIDRQVARLQDKKGPKKAASRAKVTRAQYILGIVRGVKAWHGDWWIPELKKKQPVKGATRKQREAERDRKRSKGFDDGVALRAKNTIMNKSKLDVASQTIAIADNLNSPELATVALLEACIFESNFDPHAKNPTSTAVGLLQLLDIHYNGSIEKREDVETVVTQFLKGPAFTGSQPQNPDALGAMGLARKHPDWPPGKIASILEGSGYNGSSYDQYRAEAKKILAAWGSTAGKAARFRSYEFKVDKHESYWDAIQRLANEVGWVAFFSGTTFFYMSEEDLYDQRARFRLSEDTPGVSNIDFKASYRKKIDTVTINCRIDAWPCPPGSAIFIEGQGPGDGKYLVDEIRRNLFSPEATITAVRPANERDEPRPDVLPQGGGAVDPSTTAGGVIQENEGAKGIVDQAVTVAQTAGGAGVYVVSALRPGSTTTSGNPSDHGQNDYDKAARDIGVRGVDAIVGPPPKELDLAIIALGKSFGRDYKKGVRIVDEFTWVGFRIQIIWRTPEFGGHMGHIHVGAKRTTAPSQSEQHSLGPELTVPSTGGGKLWHPNAERVPMTDGGSFTGGGHKIVHHTTEGSSAQGAISALRSKNAASHFVFDHDANKIYQLIALNKSGRALQHTFGPETNRANAIQIEHVGFTSECSGWSDAAYERIAALCRWIEDAFDVPRSTGVSFLGPPTRLSPTAWVDYKGHIGHMHCPGNDHVDPTGFRINKVI
jgi:hypothetical protein